MTIRMRVRRVFAGGLRSGPISTASVIRHLQRTEEGGQKSTRSVARVCRLHQQEVGGAGGYCHCGADSPQ
jgi:hypothetical protein